MADKVFVNSDNTATLICPNCKKTKVVDVSSYLHPDGPSRLKVKCPCRHTYVVYLEKRKTFRKDTCLEGIYQFPADSSSDGSPGNLGQIQVINISKTGMRIKFYSKPRFRTGDLINVQFHLDDSNQTFVNRNVYVKNIRGMYAGVEFASRSSLDSAIGFYLFR